MTKSNDPIISKKEILNLLKECTGYSRIGLPRDIDFSLQNGTLRVNILKPAHNMQTNGSAFEGWIMPLKAGLPDKITNVVLDYISPPDLPPQRYGNEQICHYNRFLYRINNFMRLFPDWFSLEDSKSNEVSEFVRWLKQKRCILNHSLHDRISAIKTDRKERQIESWFAFEDGKERICEQWQIDQNNLFNQLPIGLFYKEISAKNAIFPRGAGAIDLWGVGKNGTTLHIIELKCGDNINMGVISEVLFYTAVIFDTCVSKDTLFSFGRYGKSSSTKDMLAIQNGHKNFQQLHSHILAERYHPLFSDQVMQMLSKGLSKLNIRFDRAKYNYEKKSSFMITDNLTSKRMNANTKRRNYGKKAFRTSDQGQPVSSSEPSQ